MLGTTTIAGLHDYVLEQVISRVCPSRGRAVDLGAGSGALAVRLRGMGWEVCGADQNAKGFQADVPFTATNLDQQDFAARLGEQSFRLVTAVEVIEHVESPIGFLRNVGRLLRPDGVAVITTPNVDNVPARVKFLLKGRVRMMDENGEPTHISPIFRDLFSRQFLPRSGLEMVEHSVFPPRGYRNTRPRYAWGMILLGWLLSGDSLHGDNHVFVLRRAPAPEGGAA